MPRASSSDPPDQLAVPFITPIGGLRRSYHRAMRMPVVLQSKRLSLRILGTADLDPVHALFSSDGHTIGDGPIGDRGVTLEWLKRRTLLYEERGLAWYGLRDGDGSFVGNCGVFGGRCGDEPEIGYEIAQSRRGRGYAAEAVSAVTHAAHAAGQARLWATIRPWNVVSVRTAVANEYRFVRCEPDAKGDLEYYVHEVATTGGR
jgi:RimJ/RimL family protein N-acetyltransferase